MAVFRGAARVPAPLVLLLAVVVALAASVMLVQRGASPAPAAVTAPAGVEAPTEARELVRFVSTAPEPPALPPPGDAEAEPAPEPDPVAAADPEPQPAPEPVEVDERATQRPGDVEGRMMASVLPMLDPDELAATATRVGIPERALAAYASAALRLREEQPNCNLTWVTLAGVGYVESHHGTIGDRRILPDGTVSGPIVGVALDGGPSVRAIRDTDAGAYDGDTRWDRAVGPMQFIPWTWARWGADGTGDGQDDPQHIDDAALAAARYLCASGRDLNQQDNWGQALWSYNRSEAYIRNVLSVANTYAERANAGD